MPNPKMTTKATLLKAVKELNEKCYGSIKVSGTVADLLLNTEKGLSDMSSMSINDNLSTESVAQLIAWGLIDVEFLGEEEVPDGLQTTLDAIDENTVQASMAKKFESSEVSEDEKDENPADELKETIKELTGKHAKAVKKGKKKKINKIVAKLDAAKAALMELKAKDKVDPNEAKIEKLVDQIKVLKKTMPEKKKKAKKQQKQIDELTVELEDLMGKANPAKKKPAKKKDDRQPGDVKLPAKGIIREIAEAMMTGWVSTSKIYKHLVEAFPDKENPEGMKSTIKVQIGGNKQPLRIERDRGVVVEVKGEGDKRKYRIV